MLRIARCSAVPHVYGPILDLKRRCEFFRAKPGDPDQRTGGSRWPFLLAPEAPPEPKAGKRGKPKVAMVYK